MAMLVAEKVVDVYDFFFVSGADSRMVEYPLLGSPWTFICITAFYIYFCLSLGPRLVKDRPPLKMDKFIIALDLFQVVFNTAAFVVIMCNYRMANYLCNPLPRDDSPHSLTERRLFYAYFILKLIDYLDTVVIVLRKKGGQLSFLHLYHHFGVASLAWGATRYFPGGNGLMLGALNTFVHAVMYAYYLLVLLGFNSIVKWKKNLTQMQMIQFVILFLHGMQMILFQDCDYPIMLYTSFVVPQSLFMLALFYDFYCKAYGPKSQPASEAEATDDNVRSTNSQKTD